jgi:hypothetical protein
MWRKNWRKKGEKGEESDGKKDGHKHLLESCKTMYVKEGRARKMTERKICNTHLLESWEAIFKCEKKGEKGREG